MMDILMKIFLVALLVTILVAVAGSLIVILLPDFLEGLDDCKEAIRKRKRPKAPEDAAVKIVTKEAPVRTLRAVHIVDNCFVAIMPPEEFERSAVTYLSQKLTEGIVPFMEVRSEKNWQGTGTMFTAELKVVDTGNGLGRWMEAEHDND